MISKSRFSTFTLWLVCSVIPMTVIAAPAQKGQGYMARQESLRTFFDALSAPLGKPIVVSKAVARKTITGDFSLQQPQRTLEQITRQMGLIRYDDGQTVYLYDAAEAKSTVIALNTITVDKLQSFLRRSGLLDARYPLRTDGLRTFYISGPPIYVDLVMQAAQFMDNQSSDLQLGQQRIGVIRLQNTFVGDRKYEMRDESVTVPGMATVIEALLRGEKRSVDTSVSRVGASGSPMAMPDFPLQGLSAASSGATGNESTAIARELGAGNIRVVAYPDTNSLLVKGLPDQVRFIENLAFALDEAKRHVELSLWIIDLQKDDLNQLGVNWQGAVKVGSQFSASLNGGTSATTLDGASFMAQVMALERNNRANVVSRPIILTQENVPAIFDNNRTFYAQLIGDHAVDLQHVTYGTMVSVLPRFTLGDQIEMSLSIEDGSEVDAATIDRANNEAGTLPTVGRTRISTVARVPQGKSLLVGGFTRDESGEQIGRIPLLGSIPYVGRLFSYRQTRKANTVRVFLIQPREIVSPMEVDARTLAIKASDFGMHDATDRAVLKAIER
jgi:type III secretion protein C